LILVKIFPWMLASWLGLTKRWRALAISVVLAPLMLAVSWWLVGFSGLAGYPGLLRDNNYLLAGSGQSVSTALLDLGLPLGEAEIGALALAASLVVLACRVLRGPDGERRAFALIVLAALIGAPHIWAHYLVLLFVPIALRSPGFSLLWFAPLVSDVTLASSGIMWLAPDLALQLGLVLMVLAWDTPLYRFRLPAKRLRAALVP
jgi:hypothetical protein